MTATEIDHSALAAPARWKEVFADPAEAERVDWGNAPHAFTVARPLRSLVSRQLIEHWLAFGNIRYPQFNVSFAGHAAPPTAVTCSIELGEHRLVGCADPVKIADHVRRGATLTLVNPEYWDEPTAAFCRTLAADLATDVETYVYLTAPGRFGSQAHRDLAEVFVVQVEGTKRWYLFDLPADDEWGRGLLPGDPQPTEVIDLSPGDGLYVPAGMGHRAEAGSEGSIHITISVMTPRLNEVVTAWAAEKARRLPRQARLALDPADRLDQVRDLLEAITRDQGDVDAAALLGRLAERGRIPRRASLSPSIGESTA